MAEKIEETLHELAKFHFILSEGRKGHHLLFSPQVIRKTFARNPEDLKLLFQKRLDEINETLNHTFSLQSFEDKRKYIESLQADLQHAIVFGYFQLLEGEGRDVEEAPLH